MRRTQDQIHKFEALDWYLTTVLTVFFRSFGVVYLAERSFDAREVAIKVVTLGNDEEAQKEIQNLQNEIQILQKCNSHFVVKYFNSFEVQKLRSTQHWVRFANYFCYANTYLSSPQYLTKILVEMLCASGHITPLNLCRCLRRL